VESDRYAEEWNGLFPRLVLASAVLSVPEFLIEYFPNFVIVRSTSSANLATALARYDTVYAILNPVFIPFVVFALFYLAARVRINLSEDSAKVALSIFLGALLAFLPLYLIDGLAGDSGIPVVDTVIGIVGSSAATSLYYTFIGFSAVLLSYYRRM